MLSKLARYGIAFTLTAMAAGQSAADEQTDREIKWRKAAAYAQTVYAQYPSEKPYFLNDKTPDGQGLADEVYAIFRKTGKDALVYDRFDKGYPVRDYPSIQAADVLFCGCTSNDAKALKDAVTKQGFTGQFVHLSMPQ